MRDFKKIMVANRGEIALRVIRSIQESGKIAVAVYSDADLHSPHVLLADEAYHIGESTAAESYLNISRIIETALFAKVDAIHPGYGFLSENSTFSKAVADSGMVFIGPDPRAIEMMGDKITSKKTVRSFNVPLLPGSEGPIESIEEGKELADKIGYPILIKASAGGGGKGMRIVHTKDDFVEMMERAVSEAKSAFGNGSVFIEKYISNPKHIEFQVLRDSFGNTVHVFERECSIQRRYQKVIEEAPSPVMDEKLRAAMGEAAINVAESCNYLGAGTVEFIFDENKDFYFLEMNTRLQVEHPVTEMISGIDLVKEQIRIAEGKPLSFKMEDLHINGHAIELRVYAEDPFNNFLPGVGELKTYRIPSGPGVRVDDGYTEGMKIPVFYDPMISKLIVHGNNRNEAIQRMLRVIKEYKITGVPTSLPFCEFVLNHKDFIDGTFTTSFVEKNWNPDEYKSNMNSEEASAALVAGLLFNETKTNSSVISTENQTMNYWKVNRKQ